MAFVKLDCGILNSTLWDDRDAREVFITALLMAVPHELTAPAPTIEIRSLEPTGWAVPIGWYGFVHAAGVGIVRQSGMERDPGLDALERLAKPEPDSRTPDFDGRRLVRVDGGYIVLNFDKYRQKDHTAAERSKRYRERRASRVANVTPRVTDRRVTQAEAEVEAEEEGEKGKENIQDAPTALVGVSVVRANGKKGGLPVRSYDAITARITALFAETSENGERHMKAQELRELQAEIVFAYWAAKLNHKGAMLDLKRVNLLKKTLQEANGNVHELLFVVDGARKDDYLMGRSGRGTTKYDGIETLFRDRGQVEKLSEKGGYTPGTTHPMAEKYEALVHE